MPEIAIFDHYEVLTRDDGSLYELGRGAMGVTYKAFDTSLRFPVCLKVINSAYLNSEVARQRFVREARSAAKLRHRNVASVFHLGTEGDTWFYAMEFIDGETLEAVIKREGTLAPRVALEITGQVARALNAATQHGLVHRDIKPANLMLVKEDDEIVAKVIDFGLAKTALGAEGEDAATLSLGGFVGTPHFASPEQLEEREIDVRSDIYSLGVTLWYMLAGQPPFGGSMAQVMSQHLSKPPPFEKFKTLPPPVSALLRKMLEKDPADRFPTPAELRRTIEEVLGKLAHAPAESRAAASDSAVEVEPEEFATLLDVAAKRPGETRFEAGVTIAGRYRIAEAMGETNAGRVFRAEDTAQSRPVRLLVLHQEILNDSVVCTALEREVERLAQVKHPNLLGIFNFETIENASFLAMEWTNGFSLLDLLRARRELVAEEAIALLMQAAVGVDYALKRGLTGLEFGLHQMMVHFDAPFEKDKLLRAPMGKWPTFTLKLYPLGVTRDLNTGRTWAGGQTMVGGAMPGDADEVDAKGRYIRSLATVIYELLGGTISPLMLGGAGMPASRYTPLSTLSEEGNEVLKRALDPAQTFEGAQEFCNALTQPDGMHGARREQAPPAARREAAPPLPQRKPAPPAGRREMPAPVKRPEPEPPVRPRESAAPVEASAGGQPPAVAPSRAVPPLAGPITQRVLPPKKSNAPVMILGAAVALLALGGGGYFLLHKPAEPIASATPAPAPTVTPIATPALRLTAELTSTPAPRIVETPAPRLMETPAPTPRPPDPTQRLAAAIKAAEALEQRGDPQAALEGYLKVVKDFPDIGAAPGRNHIETLLDDLLHKKPPIARDQFELLKDSIEEAAQQGVLAAQLLLGVNEVKQDPKEAFQWFQKATDAGSPLAMKELGQMYASGIPNVVEKDLTKSVEYFRQAAEKNYVPAKYLLAECYMDGKGVPKDEVAGMKLLREAAALKDVLAMNRLGATLARPGGLRPDSARKEEFEEAFNVLTQAKNLGYAEAMGNLAVMYFNGFVPGSRGPDPKEGAKLFAEGAKEGSLFCMVGYARCLETGTGIKANMTQAGNWYEKAANAGDKTAEAWCRAHPALAPGFTPSAQ